MQAFKSALGLSNDEKNEEASSSTKEHKEGEHEKYEGDQDLTTILDKDQRNEFSLLVAKGAESIRQSIEAIFDASKGGQVREIAAPVAAEDDDAEGSKDSEAAAAQAENEKKQEEQRGKELSSSTMRQLKTDALKFVDEWREKVLARVGGVVSSEEQAKEQKGEAEKETEKDPTQWKRDIGDEDEDEDEALRALYPPIPTSLSSLPKEQRVLLLHSMLLLLLSLEHYVSHSRALLLYLTTSLKLPLKVFQEDEIKVAKGLLEAAAVMSGDEETAKKAEENKNSRFWKVGLATVAGATVIGFTGGLAAPMVAAGVGGVMSGIGLGATAAAGYLGTLASSGVLVGSLFGAYGGRMTGQMMDSYAKEVDDFAFLPVHVSSKKKLKNGKDAASTEDRRLRVTIGISGWLTTKEEVVTPWCVVGKGSESFALRYELDALLNLGNSMTAMVQTAVWGYAKKEIIKRTLLASLWSALWPLSLLKIKTLVDNPFSVAKSRAEKAGEVLADALINKAQGERPVTLIGFSLGARVIYTCLMSLAKRKAFGLVESVVLIGAPTPSDANDWRLMRSMVTGRLVNVYSVNDYILAFLYRTSSIQFGIAGLQKIDGVAGVENIDVSSIVSGHLRYRYLVGTILKKIGFEDVLLSEVAREEETLRLVELEEAEEEAKNSGKDVDKEADAMEKKLKLEEEDEKKANEKKAK